MTGGILSVLPARFQDDDVVVESLYSVTNSIHLLNDLIYWGMGDSVTGGGFTITPSMVRGVSGAEADIRSILKKKTVLGLRAGITIIESFELLCEKVGNRCSIGRRSLKYPMSKDCSSIKNDSSKIIFILELMKTVSRIMLLSIHYNNIIEFRRTSQGKHCVPGLLQYGGSLFPGEKSFNVSDEYRIKKKEEMRATEQIRLKNEASYVGRRTGWHFQKKYERRNQTCLLPLEKGKNTKPMNDLMFLSGEFLHIIRPLFTIRCHGAFQANTVLTWLIGLVIDVASHRLTISAMGGKENLVPPTKDEITRRKFRWLLYCLRQPMWHLLTERTLGVIESMLNTVAPGIGRLISGYIVSLLHYSQKHHFMLEGLV